MTKEKTTLPARRNFRDNFKTAFGTSGRTGKSGTYVMRNGKLVPMEKADVLRLRKTDSVNIVSEATGINPSQIPQFERAFGHLGVKYTPDGQAVYKDRKSKLAVLKARGYHDKNEVCG